MSKDREIPPGKGPPSGQFDPGPFAAYPMIAHAAALVVCASLVPGALAAGEPGPLESLYVAAGLFAAGLVAALWAGYSGRILNLRAGGAWAGLNFIVPMLLSAALLLLGALFGLALASTGM